ncbi:hypothetical protein LCGC14_1505000 [marine sediment metagenome]|uniref:Uncharacterized protein n=1 Tax=marine sediment metagenome TaxID=412755 RepID=A0A0F9J2Z8_9ZZZZ
MTTGRDRQINKRVSRQVRIWRVLRMKMAGGTDREIQKQLENDSKEPVKISPMQVNRDWHAALDEVSEANKHQVQRLRTLMAVRLERLLMTQWTKATSPGAPTSAVEMCRRLIHDQTELFGLAREIGDEERPLNIQEAKTDYGRLSDEDVDTLLDIAERQEAAEAFGDNGARPTES